MQHGETGDVLVITVTWNSGAHIGPFVESLAAGMQGVDSWRLVVVDNASSDHTRDEVARVAPWATVVNTGHNAGYAAGVNEGLRLLGPARAVIILNPDVRLETGCGRQLVEALDEPATGITVPRQQGTDGRLLFTLRRAPTVRRALGEAILGGLSAGRSPGWGELVLDESCYEQPSRADWATGSAMAISRACLDAVGPWDERFFLYSEETDFALRARDAGFGLRLAPGAVCTHFQGDSHASPALWGLLMANRVRLFRLRAGAVRTAAFRVALLAGESLRAARGRTASRAALAMLVRSEKGIRDHIARLQAGAPGAAADATSGPTLDADDLHVR